MARRYNYASVPFSSHGLMRCSVCSRHITEGRYRYYEKPAGFVTQHEACVAGDPEWARMDELARRAQHECFVAACVEFRREWGVDDLDHYLLEHP